MPPTKEQQEIVKESMDQEPTSIAGARDYTTELKRFFEDGLQTLEETDYRRYIIQMIENCWYMRDIYKMTCSSEIPNDISTFRKIEQLSIRTSSKAHDCIGYRIAKLERVGASRPGAKAKAERMHERIEQFIEELRESGIQRENRVEISRDEFHKIFQRLEIYSDPTKRKYKDIAEKQLSEETGEKQKITIKK